MFVDDGDGVRRKDMSATDDEEEVVAAAVAAEEEASLVMHAEEKRRVVLVWLCSSTVLVPSSLGDCFIPHKESDCDLTNVDLLHVPRGENRDKNTIASL